MLGSRCELDCMLLSSTKKAVSKLQKVPKCFQECAGQMLGTTLIIDEWFSNRNWEVLLSEPPQQKRGIVSQDTWDFRLRFTLFQTLF
jgi:hypothetical protein